MRKKVVAQKSLLDQAMDWVLSVFQPDEKLKKMDAIIEDNPDIVAAIHDELTWMVRDSGRSGLLSAERREISKR